MSQHPTGCREIKTLKGPSATRPPQIASQLTPQSWCAKYTEEKESCRDPGQAEMTPATGQTGQKKLEWAVGKKSEEDRSV